MEKLYWIWLQTVLGQGNAVADVIVKQEISPRELYYASESQLAKYDFLTPALARKMKKAPLEKAEKILRQCEGLKIWLMVPSDDDYPQRLKNIYQVPLVLYGVGDRSLLSKDLLITMVGTRKATTRGTQSAYDLARDLAQYGFGIVSGMALGIDSWSHQGALDQGGVTIGVSGCGLDVNYPSANVELRRRIGRNGAIITEYPPGSPAAGHHFPVRNRIVSGLSLGTVVVEAAAKSGTLITADLAMEQGRDVFALPTDLYNSNGEGNLNLIGQGATIVLSPETIVEEYSALYGDRMSKTIESRVGLRRNHADPPEEKAVKREEIPKEQPKMTQAPKVEEQALPEDETQRKVLELLSEKPLRAEEIALLCQMEMQEVLVILSELEIEGYVKAYPGKQFGR